MKKGITKEKMRQVLVEGNGLFWDIKEGKIYSKSPEEVAKLLGLKSPGQSIDIPLDIFLQSPAMQELLEELSS